jgi:hypothetical protein
MLATPQQIIEDISFSWVINQKGTIEKLMFSVIAAFAL